MRQARPHEHGAVRVGPLPANRLEPVAEGVAPLLVEVLLVDHLVARARERRDGRVLDGQEHAVVELAAQLVGGSHHVRPAHEEADAGARDVERLGEAEELDAHLVGTGVVEEAVALDPVEDDVAVGVVVNDQQVMGTGELDDLGVDLRRAHRAHRVCRQRHHHVLGTVGHLGVDAVHVGQEVVLGRERVEGKLGPDHHGRGAKQRVARVGDEHRVALVEQRQRQAAHALLRAVDAHDHVGRDSDAEAALVVGADGVLELGKVRDGILPVVGVLRGRHERVHHVRRRLEVRRAHREVDDRATLGLELVPAVVERGEDLVAKLVESLRELHACLREERGAPPARRGARIREWA